MLLVRLLCLAPLVAALNCKQYNEDHKYDFHDIGLYDPHVAPSCDSATDNARGYYTARYVPCEFIFHTTAIDNRTGLYTMSTVCTDDNKVENPAVRGYVQNWPDECVGDFARCYSIAEDEQVFVDFICTKQWELPPGATHMSVNCTADKQLVILEHQHAVQHEDEQQQRQFHEYELFWIIVIIVLFLGCFLFVCFVNRCIVAPYREPVLANARRQEQEDLMPAETDGITAQIA